MRTIYRLTIIFLLVTTGLFGALKDKSAMVYYGNDISYSMVGIHDYIIVQPELINIYSHGFKIYKDKMYAYVSINEIQSNIKEYQYVDESWIVSENPEWNSKVLDIKNRDYQEFVFKRLIEPRMKEGFKNFFFDTLDSYQLATKTDEEREASRKELVHFIKEFHRRYPDSKLIINRGFDIIDEVHEGIEAVLFESYYRGLGGVTGYKELSDGDREWIDIHLDKIKKYGIDIISLEYLNADSIESEAKEVVEKIKRRGMIPYVSHRELVIYGKSSKNAIKREVFTLIDESVDDRLLQLSTKQGALVLEYLGYIQKVHDINQGLPDIDKMRHYSGVIIWMDSSSKKNPKEFIVWIQKLIAIGIKVSFAGSFAGLEDGKYLKPLGIKITSSKYKKAILHQDKMIAYEIEPTMSGSSPRVKIKHVVKPLLVYQLSNDKRSTVSAITEWGGYAVNESFMTYMNKSDLWIIDPFEFIQQSLRLKKLIVPDVTTENGKRLLFTHIDGDGIMSRVEGDQTRFAGDAILEDILIPYKIPHSVSVIGAEIDADGLYPELSEKMTEIAKEIYKLDNVEAITHTFTHPFDWGKIVDDNLDRNYRLKVKDYNFSLERELSQSIRDINENLIPKGKPLAKTVFWSGNCMPRKNALSHVYKNGILNMNGGDTLITIDKPWLANIAPLGIERAGYYQIYTGAQNENVFTNDWLGPFWGFKRVVQTFKLTNSPRRLKPIDIYYHIYSGSKMASLNALKYVFDWSIKQDVMPIFTSEYILRVMDFYIVSFAQDGDDWLLDGMKDLNTIRIEERGASIDFSRSQSALGIKHFENHTYISFDSSKKHYFTTKRDSRYKKSSYLISSNAKVIDYDNFSAKKRRFSFKGHVDLELDFHLADGCKIYSKPRAKKVLKTKESTKLFYKGKKSAVIDIKCR
ncbi:MAG: endo alpha-1,4 polygalactosaminidase [Campylobacterota bacterium]|nr:endo alpha-1,4 polygalactosaminidase [Campylobacterota bacterium]